jgi:hypothetical protein
LLGLFARVLSSVALATPANKAGLARHYDRFLAKELAQCTTCHLPSERKAPESLDDFPHNPFGHRLRLMGEELVKGDKAKDIAARLKRVAREDSDGDGADNETELLLGHNPGDPADTPTKQELASAPKKRAEFAQFLSSYHWNPFEPVPQPAAPKVQNRRWVRNPIDAFIAAEHSGRGLRPRPEASKEILLRRVYLDLIGLSPTPEEQRAFLADPSSDAYEKVVDRRLSDPRHGERWGRHWMDVWRYSDWAGWSGGNQIRDSKPHVWRWRDWIVESLNADKGYDRMILEMLAADELAPEDTDALRATGYLVRNYKMLSREQWLEDTIKHTAQAFLGLTVGCAKCHNHPVDPISQAEYYQIRAIFEPHQVRTDRVPGQLDTAKDGLVRVFDTDTNAPTYFYVRGDERHPDTNRLMSPGVLQVLGGKFQNNPLTLPRFAAQPDRRDFVINDTIAAGEKAISDARGALAKAQTNPAPNGAKLKEAELSLAIAEAKQAALLAVVRAEKLEERNRKETDDWKTVASDALAWQRKQAVLEARLKLHDAETAQAEAQRKFDGVTSLVAQTEQPSERRTTVPTAPAAKKTDADKVTKDLEAARQKTAEAERALAKAEKQLSAPGTAYKPRAAESYPASSTGRRLALARWMASSDNPLTARVAMNHIWLRHFGQGIVATPADFGSNGRPPSHPQLLDWLAGEFMSRNWSMKAMHRLIVTSSTYRMASTPDESNAKVDPDNTYLWRVPSRRMEAELVRDNLLDLAGDLDVATGGPDIDHQQGLTSRRRSIYLRIAAEKEVEFLKIFDGPSVTECYARRPTVVPQQALALSNNELTLREARRLAEKWSGSPQSSNAQFAADALRRILARAPRREELKLCEEFLAGQSGKSSRQRARKSRDRAFQSQRLCHHSVKAAMSRPHNCPGVTRRSFLVDTGMGFTGLALSAMLFRDSRAHAEEAGWHPPTGTPPFQPRAKSVIWIFLCGGVSHVESFDVKPELNKYAGKSIADTPYQKVLENEGKNIIGANPSHGNRKVIMPLQAGYQSYGQSGLVVGDWFRNIGECADDLAVVRSLWTIHNDHGAQLTWQTGRHPRELEHPTLGSWISYGLGSMNENLPEYVVLGVPTGDCCGGAFTTARPISVRIRRCPAQRRSEEATGVYQSSGELGHGRGTDGQLEPARQIEPPFRHRLSGRSEPARPHQVLRTGLPDADLDSGDTAT